STTLMRLTSAAGGAAGGGGGGSWGKGAASGMGAALFAPSLGATAFCWAATGGGRLSMMSGMFGHVQQIRVTLIEIWPTLGNIHISESKMSGSRSMSKCSVWTDLTGVMPSMVSQLVREHSF